MGKTRYTATIRDAGTQDSDAIAAICNHEIAGRFTETGGAGAGQ